MAASLCGVWVGRFKEGGGGVSFTCMGAGGPRFRQAGGRAHQRFINQLHHSKGSDRKGDVRVASVRAHSTVMARVVRRRGERRGGGGVGKLTAAAAAAEEVFELLLQLSSMAHRALT